ncbi:PHB depolymerase family esterase [Diaporthe helianthi]|uniref:Carboxylic ester hydrolase n=1 Tax=Diaporthe helianthi TaxID=158607 RepID=A0A2P5HES8_DIAHE|nr:PHB depolymerase family esterase [Diaporthe helianthi]
MSSVAFGLSFLASVQGALVQVTNFGSNPTALEMYVDLPENVTSNAPVILALHGCGGSAQRYYGQNNLAAVGTSRGAIMIYPSATDSTHCWDSGTPKSLTRDGGGDTQGLVQMVQYVLSEYNADPARVFAVGRSSGAMMSNALAAVYPDVFAATSVYSGVAAGCMAVPEGVPANPMETCAKGNVTKTAQEWGETVRSYNPGYEGPYPRMQIWHGTSDVVVVYHNLIEELKEWSAVHDVPFTRNVTSTPQADYTQMIYGDGSRLVGYSAVGVGHVVPEHESETMAWFGISSAAQ